MSSSSSPPEYLPITTTADDPKLYTARAQAVDCLKFLTFIAFLAVLLGALPAVARFLIFLQPSLPVFTLEPSSLSVVNVSNTGIVTANWTVTVLVTNPNGKDMVYDEINAVAVGGRVALSSVAIAGFETRGGDQTRLRAMFGGLMVEAGGVNLTMEMETEVKYGGWTWPARRDAIKVVCGVVRAEVPSKVTKVEVGSKECDFDGEWKRLVRKWRKLFWDYIYVVAIFLGILIFSF